MSGQATVIKRVRFREQQVLLASDLYSEQQYQLAQRRRHNIAHHQWGIVYGLALLHIRPEVDSTAGVVVIQPGMAIDGYGRELVLYQEEVIHEDQLRNYTESNLVDIWLLYDQLEQVDKVSSRWIETVCLELSDGFEDVDPLVPPVVQHSHLDFKAFQALPDRSAEWPVYLGRVCLGACERLLTQKRPFITTVGRGVRFGHSFNEYSECEMNHAAINNQPLMSVSKQERVDKGGAVQLTKETPFTIDGEGNVRADALLIDEGVLRLGADEGDTNSSRSNGVLSFKKFKKAPENALANQIYATQYAQEDGTNVSQLRIELEHPGDAGNPGDVQLAFGFHHEKAEDTAQFLPVMTVDLNGRLEINGDLIISNQGQLVTGQIPADINDHRFRIEVENSFLQSQAATINKMELVYNTNLVLTAKIENITTDSISFRIEIVNKGNLAVNDLELFTFIRVEKNNKQIYKDPRQKPTEQLISSIAPGSTELSDLIERKLPAERDQIEIILLANGHVNQIPISFDGYTLYNP